MDESFVSSVMALGRALRYRQYEKPNRQTTLRIHSSIKYTKQITIGWRLRIRGLSMKHSLPPHFDAHNNQRSFGQRLRLVSSILKAMPANSALLVDLDQNISCTLGVAVGILGRVFRQMTRPTPMGRGCQHSLNHSLHAQVPRCFCHRFNCMIIIPAASTISTTRPFCRLYLMDSD